LHIEYVSDIANAETILITDLLGRMIQSININDAYEFHGNIDMTEFDCGARPCFRK
jgi:hypothetical protein